MSAIFLDLDGTLVDPKPGITGSVIHALSALGLPAPSPDALEWVIGPPLIESFSRLGAPDPAQALAIYRDHYSAGAMFDVQIYPGIVACLDGLQPRHDLYLATAKPHVYATQITAHTGLSRFLADQFGPELDGTRNDKGDLLRYACAQLSLDPTACVMVGDRANDLMAARATGMRFIGASWGYGQDGELADADLLCAMPDELSAKITALLTQ